MKTIFIMCLLAIVFFVRLGNAEISLGVQTKIWPFMWANGKSLKMSKVYSHQSVQWEVAERNLDMYSKIGGKWNVVSAYQEIDGTDGFKRLREVVNQHKVRGIGVVLRLYENVKTYAELLPNPSPDYAYNKEYYEWVNNLTQNFKNDVEYYLISNEAELDLASRYYDARRSKSFHITYNQYKKLLNTAYKAVKDVDNTLQVVDHGISGYSLGLAVANDVYRKNGLAEALTFWKEFRYGHNKVNNSIQMLHLLLRKDVARRVEFAERTYSDPGPADAFQLHHYGNWRSLPKLLDWMLDRMEKGGSVRPIFAAEVGYSMFSIETKDEFGRIRRTADWARYSEEQHAEFIVKDFVFLLCSGVDRIQYWDLRWDNDKVPIGKLFHASNDPDKFIPFKAGTAFEYLANLANGRTETDIADTEFKELQGCALKSDDTVLAVWADGDHPVEIAVTENIQKVVNMYGQQIRNNSEIGDGFIIGNDLVYVYIK